MNQEPITSTSFLSGEAFDSLPSSIQGYIRHLETTIQLLQGRVRDLEARISKNSSNSSKPPSSDGMNRKIKSQRHKSDKKPGAQKDHIGKGLLQRKNPDVIVTHSPVQCVRCGHDLQNVRGECAEKRQVFNVPRPKIDIHIPRRRRGMWIVTDGIISRCLKKAGGMSRFGATLWFAKGKPFAKGERGQHPFFSPRGFDSW